MHRLTFWGLTASPFQLKMQALADYAEVPWRRLPGQGGLIENLSFLRRLQTARRARAVQRYPQGDAALDEYPSVPFYSFDQATFYYDSSGLARHLDVLQGNTPPLLPDDPAQRFIADLIDESFDELGLYIVHHNRWVVSARTNTMGSFTARELAPWLPGPLQGAIARRLARRQSQRCPYLFSVAGIDYISGVPDDITPPARDGFPATHALLDGLWLDCLKALEHHLSAHAFLLGERFTLADASAYGSLGMNLVDGRSAELLEQHAPRTYRWLSGIRDGEHIGSRGKLYLADSLTPLLTGFVSSFISLMQQNHTAWVNAQHRDQSRCNEGAFNRGEAIYEGDLAGSPFRAVIKSFQVAVWLELLKVWAELPDHDQAALQSQFEKLKALPRKHR